MNSRNGRLMREKTVPSHVEAINIEAAVRLFRRPYDREGNARLQSTAAQIARSRTTVLTPAVTLL
jgi:hypothetical protein